MHTYIILIYAHIYNIKHIHIIKFLPILILSNIKKKKKAK
jgi:hypothetical protein